MIVAIDPGLTGALAVMTPDRTIVYLADLPVMRDGTLAWIDGVRFNQMLNGFYGQLRAIVVERVQPNPKNGGISMRSSGLTLGSILAVAQLHGPIETVPPQTWKSAQGLLARRDRKLSDLERKRQSLNKARLMYPDAPLDLEKHHNRAEAILLGDWYIRNRYGNHQAAMPF